MHPILGIVFRSSPDPLFKPMEMVYFWKVLKVTQNFNGKLEVAP